MSILLVLGAHLLPLGPKWLQLNHTAGAMGMAVFFTLSGFLIVGFLANGAPIGSFMLKRFARIVPLCWLAILFLATWHSYDPTTVLQNLLFVANIPPVSLLGDGGEHLWSLNVEMQFYVLVAGLCWLFGRRSLHLVPLLAIAVTVLRIVAGERISIVTWHRLDEILAGGTLVLIVMGWWGRAPAAMIRKIPVWLPFVCFVLMSHPASGPLQYFRPYAAALMVGASLAHAPRLLEQVLTSRPMRYIAEISYALYVIHGVLSHTWLGTGDLAEKYVKRPFLFVLTFVLAHLSTRYLERPITQAVRRGTHRRLGDAAGQDRDARPTAGLADPASGKQS